MRLWLADDRHRAGGASGLAKEHDVIKQLVIILIEEDRVLARTTPAQPSPIRSGCG
jgi:hypothetical protein